MRWNEYDTYRFVKLYLEHENLWNRNDPYYRSKVKRFQSINEIRQEFESATGITLNSLEVKKKINNLRSTYGMEYNKYLKKRSYKSRLKWFYLMHKHFKNQGILMPKAGIGLSLDDFAKTSEDAKYFSDEQYKEYAAESHKSEAHSVCSGSMEEDPIDERSKQSTSKSNEKWDAKETLAFVKIYLSHPNLWDPQNPLHRNKSKRNLSIKKISEEFAAETGIALTQFDVTSKIKILRSTYGLEYAKVITRSTSQEAYVPKMLWYHEMDKCFQHRGIGIPKTMKCKQDVTEHDTEEEEYLDDELLANECTPPKTKTRKKHHHEECEEIEKYFYPPESSTLVTSPVAEKSNDEFDFFARHVASQLRTMKIKSALRVQNEIQDLLTAARIQDM